MSKLLAEKWDVEGVHLMVDISGDWFRWAAIKYLSLGDVERAKLAAAAPDMCRALLAVEWNGDRSGCRDGCPSMCPDCRGLQRRWEHANWVLDKGHKKDCTLDSALIKAGLPDQESRCAARKELGI